MGNYCFCEISLEFTKETTIKEIDSLMSEIKNHQDIAISNENNGYFEIQSMRPVNLQYQCELVNEIVKKHSCVEEASFNAYEQIDIGLYYNKKEEED